MKREAVIKPVLTAAVAVLLGCSGAAMAVAQEKKVETLEAIGVGNIATVDATVDGVDMSKRTVILRGPQGNSFVVAVSDRVKNLDQVRKGDVVSATYYDELAIAVVNGSSGSTTQPSGSVEAVTAAAPRGELPAGAEMKRVKVVANVDDVNTQRPSITVTGPLGNQREIVVRDRNLLNGIQRGDQVELEYTEALVIAVDRKP